MQLADKIKNYSKCVCDQIRWKQAHEVISDEIESHIADQKDAFISQGYDEETSIDKAILEMGDPVFVGTQLDITHKPKPQLSMILIALLLLGIGIIIRFLFIDSVTTLYVMYIIMRTILGIVFMLTAYFIDFTIIVKYNKKVFIGLIFIFIFLIRYIDNSVYAENILLVFPTAFVGIIYSLKNKGIKGIITCYFYLIIPLVAGLDSHCFSNLFIYVIACIIILAIAISKNWFRIKGITKILLSLTLMLAIIAWFFNLILLSMTRRITPAEKNFYLEIKTIIINAPFIGSSDISANVDETFSYMNNELLLTHLVGTFGWISFVLIMAIIAIFIAFGFYLCKKQKSILGKLISTSVIIVFTFQVLFFTLSNLGIRGFIFFPTLAKLPLFSYGIVEVITNMSLIGIMLSTFKSGEVVRDKLILKKLEEPIL